MKKVQRAGLVLLIVSLLAMAVHTFLTPLSDWAVRIGGIAMIAGIFITVFCAVKRRREDG